MYERRRFVEPIYEGTIQLSEKWIEGKGFRCYAISTSTLIFLSTNLVSVGATCWECLSNIVRNIRINTIQSVFCFGLQ